MSVADVLRNDSNVLGRVAHVVYVPDDDCGTPRVVHICFHSFYQLMSLRQSLFSCMCVYMPNLT